MNPIVDGLLKIVLPMAIKVVLKGGVAILEMKFPKLAPLLEELLHVVKGSEPKEALLSAADHHFVLSSCEK